jgi:hypothetical protein
VTFSLNDNTASRALWKKAAPPAASGFHRNFGFENGLHSVPLYAAFYLDQTALTEL